MDPIPGNHEVALPEMMNRSRVFHGRVDPRLDDFDDKQAVAGDHPGVCDPAFEIGEALLDERSSDS
jgi:hypothetical protein